MNEKLTMKQLADFLAERHEMKAEDATAFVEMFFKVMEDALETDKYVKVKGLGAFKLIGSENREGNVRITFTPDTSMREGINKPFAHFESVVLGEDTHFDDMKEEEGFTDLNEVEEDLEPETETVSAMNSLEEPGTALSEAENGENGDGESQLDNSVENITDKKTLKFEENEKIDNPAMVVESSESKPSFGKSFPWCMLFSILLIGVFIGGMMVWSFLANKRYVTESILDSLMYRHVQEAIVLSPLPMVDSMSSKKTLLPVDGTLHPQDSIVSTVQKSLTKKTAAPAKKERQSLSDTLEYQITGTQSTHSIQSGENLARVAQKYYGNRRLWPYLVKHNKKIIKNADNIPVGMVIEIPELTPKK